jgi:phage-related protein
VVLGFSNLFKEGARLGPQAKEMKSALEGVKDALIGIREPVQEALFDQLGAQIKGVTAAVLPAFKQGLVDIAEVMNVSMREGMTFIGEFDWSSLFGGMVPIVENLGSAFNDFFAGFMNFTLAASPAAQMASEMFANTAQSLSDMISRGAETGAINDFLVTGLTHLSAWWDLLKGVGGALGDISEVGATFGLSMVNDLTAVVDKWREWMGTTDGQASLINFFHLAKEALYALKPIMEGVQQAWSTLFTDQSVDLLASVAEAIGAILPVIAELLAAIGNAGVLQTFAELLTQVADAVVKSGLLAKVSELASVIGTFLAGALEVVAPYLDDIALIFAQLVSAVIPVVAALGEALLPVLGALLEAFMPLLPPVVELVETLAAVLMPIIAPLGQLLATIAPILVQLFIAFNPVLRVLQLVATLLPPLEPILTLIAEAIGWVIEGLTKIIEPFVSFIAFIIEAVAGGKAFGDIFNWASDIIKVVMGKLDEFISGLKSVLSAVGDFIGRFKSFFDDALNHISTFVSNVIQWFKDMPYRILSSIGDIGAQIGATFLTMVAVVGDIVDNIVDFFVKLPGRIISAIGNIGSTIGNKIKSGMPDWVPGFAEGGIVYGPTRALVGEAGPEAVIPLTRPLNMIDPSVRGMAAMLRGMPNQAQAVSGGKTVNLTMNVYSPQADPAAVAASVMNRAAVLARG